MVAMFSCVGCGVGPNERPGTDHVISGPIRGLKKLHPMAQTDTHPDGHSDSINNSTQRGRVGENGFYEEQLLTVDHGY